jgi:predicted homoserine dehydrogenase-like protein
MNLYSSLSHLEMQSKPIRVGLIGAGKFGSMFLAQAVRLPGVHVLGIADLNPDAARSNLKLVGWQPQRYGAASLEEATRNGSTHISDDWEQLVACPDVKIIIEATGNPIAAVEHCLAAYARGKHVINVTVEADAMCGYGLARKAEQAGVIYSMAYGDQPALACHLVDWARTCGFPVVAAGRGHKWLPEYRTSTPETVWDHWGLTADQAERGRLNPKMFNAFLDGSKPAIESAAISNATGLDAPIEGLQFPPGSIDDIPTLMRPQVEGGVLERKGMVEVISCIERNGTPIPNDIRKGVWVCFEADTDYLRNCFEEYSVVTDPSGRYMASFNRWHLIGLELAVSIAAIGIRNEPTGCATSFRSDVAAQAKRDLAVGEYLDGEGGYTVSGILRPTSVSVKNSYVPLGLAHNLKLVKPVTEGSPVTWEDVECGEETSALKLRREIEQMMVAGGT